VLAAYSESLTTYKNMSDLLNQASLVYIPSGYKEDTAYSVIPTDGSGDLTFTRASDGTRVNSAGLVENVPWNLLTYSEELNNWTTSRASVTTNATTAPNGTTTADKVITDSTASTTHQIYTGPFTVPNLPFVISVYAKKSEYDYIHLGKDTSTTKTWFDLTNGAVGTQGSDVLSASIESVGNGWYRCINVINNTSTSSYVELGPASVDGSRVISGTPSGGIFAWGAQLNQGSTAKPYFPTTDRQNVPRLTYEGGCPSLLLEPQRTNLFTYSEQFDNAAWTKSLCTITANQIVSPSGYLDADLVTTSGTSDSLQQSVSVTSGTTYTFSAFVKNDSAGTIGLVVFSSFPTSVGTYNLTNGTATSGTGSPVVSIQNYGNGWYRATLTATATSTGTANFYFSSTSPDAVSTYYIWGAQVEAGSYPTSYIPTTSAAVTRVADEASKTGISSLIGQTEGTLFIEMNINKRVNLGGSGPNGLEIKDSSGNNSIIIGTAYSANQVFNLGVRNAGSFSNYLTTTNNALGTYKLAAAYSSAGFVFYINGVQIGTTATLPPSATFADMGFSQVFGTNNPNGELVNQAVIFKTALTNAELASLTTL